MTNERPNPGSLGIAYLVDDDPAVLRLLQALVASIGVESRAFTSARDFFAIYRPGGCECLVCDLRMPEIDGIALQKRLKETGAGIPIVFLTGYAEVDVAVEAMKEGAFDFVEKPFSAQALLTKIQAALELSRTRHAEYVEGEILKARLALLTPRERVVAKHVVDGKSSREVSELLGLSARTVENHRMHLMEKLRVASTVDLVKLFAKEFRR